METNHRRLTIFLAILTISLLPLLIQYLRGNLMQSSKTWNLNIFEAPQTCGFRFTNRDYYFWVDFDHFWIEQFFWSQLGKNWKLAWAWNQSTIGKFSLPKSVKDSAWEFTTLLTKIRNIFCNSKVLIPSSYS